MFPTLGLSSSLPNGYWLLTSVSATSGGNTVYSGTLTGGGSNAFAGLQALVIGFSASGGVNNGQYTVVASGTSSITLANSHGVSETSAGQLFLFTTNTNGPFLPPGAYVGSGPASGPASPGTIGANWVPDSPSGVNLANYSTSWNYSNGETSTQNYLTALTAAKNAQAGWSVVDGTNPPSPPGLNVAQTTPSAPSGSYTQSGTAYQTNATAVLLAGVRSQDFAYYRGV